MTTPPIAATIAKNGLAAKSADSLEKAVPILVIAVTAIMAPFAPAKIAIAAPSALKDVVNAARITGCSFNFPSQSLMTLTPLATPPKALVATPAKLLMMSVIFFLPTASIIFCQPFTTSASKLPKAPWNSAVPLANFLALSVEPS